MKPIPNTKRTEPLVGVDHPNYVWTTGADVQATWRRYGWIPLEEARAQKESEKLTLAIASRFTTVI